jgi:hypothetical protein
MRRIFKLFFMSMAVMGFATSAGAMVEKRGAKVQSGRPNDVPECAKFDETDSSWSWYRTITFHEDGTKESCERTEAVTPTLNFISNSEEERTFDSKMAYSTDETKRPNKNAFKSWILSEHSPLIDSVGVKYKIVWQLDLHCCAFESGVRKADSEDNSTKLWNSKNPKVFASMQRNTNPTKAKIVASARCLIDWTGLKLFGVEAKSDGTIFHYVSSVGHDSRSWTINPQETRKFKVVTHTDPQYKQAQEIKDVYEITEKGTLLKSYTTGSHPKSNDDRWLELTPVEMEGDGSLPTQGSHKLTTLSLGMTLGLAAIAVGGVLEYNKEKLRAKKESEKSGTPLPSQSTLLKNTLKKGWKNPFVLGGGTVFAASLVAKLWAHRMRNNINGRFYLFGSDENVYRNQKWYTTGPSAATTEKFNCWIMNMDQSLLV